MRASILLLALGSLVALPGSLHAQSARDIDDLVRQTMKSWRIPGLALVVVQGDKIVYLNGFGVREAGKPETVTPDTVFPIASCTKSFTTLAMGMLVDEGKLRWDDLVRKHVPYFRLTDPLADAAVTLRDVVCHRTGVAAHDLLWYGSGWGLEERIRHACKLDLDQPFRASFRYQVVFFDAAGAAVGTASGASWEDFVQKRILEPLEMKSSSCLFPAKAANLASPHRKDAAGKPSVITRFPMASAYPAGSVHATAKDLANYLRFQLGDGTWKGKRLISRENLAEPHTPQVTLRRTGALKALNPETLFLHYGMGWIVQDYRGKLLLMHGGSIDGFRAHLTLVPAERLGIAILNNLDGGLANVALSNSIIDLFLKAPAKDWDSHYLELFEQGERAEAARAKALREKSDPKLPRPATAYAGTYEDAAYGTCKVEVEKGRLMWLWSKVRCPLEHFQEETFLANEGPLVEAPFTFVVGRDGAIEAFHAIGRLFRRVKEASP
ncbi:MAG: serine hydrolase [Gemmataceae bacterium]